MIIRPFGHLLTIQITTKKYGDYKVFKKQSEAQGQAKHTEQLAILPLNICDLFNTIILIAITS